MSAQEKAIGNWNQLKGKVKQRWGQLTDDELNEVEGNFDQLVGLIQQKSGDTREQVERVVGEFSDDIGGAVSRSTEAVRQYAGQAGEMLRGAADQARTRAFESYEDAEDLFRRRPTESVAVALAVGIGVGLAIGITLAAPRRRPSTWKDRLVAEDIGHRVLQRFADILPQSLADCISNK
jgi:uncharacterized protein YjbJ (UPF0337 family)